MKKFNGTDYDGLLPLAYNALNSDLLNGKSYADIINTDLFLYTGEYRGNGLYRESNPNSITFPFVPILVLAPVYSKANNSQATYGDAIIYTNQATKEYIIGAWSIGYTYNLKKSEDGKTFSWYRSSDIQQFNQKDVMYYYAAIGGYDQRGKSEWLFLADTTFTVPKTGEYMLELYGKGRDGWYSVSTWEVSSG